MAIKKKHPFRDRLQSRLVDDLVDQGADRVEAEKVVSEMAGEHPILDLLKSLDWAALVAILLKLVVKK